jgi:GDP/UDP-N,N'-diacetylbacillosamine 2-epimerase (hydrolysing)
LRFLSCLKYIDGIIGNSSSGLLEMPSFKKGTINVGDRQRGRLKATSVINVKANKSEIIKGINTLYSKRFQAKIKNTKNPYGEGGASNKIIKLLEKIKLKNILKKKFYSLDVRCV